MSNSLQTDADMTMLEISACRALNDYNMLCENDKVIVALSGGADSVALLDFLLRINDKFSIEIMAAHVNHNLRGAESDRDEAFVKELCKKYGIRLFVKSADIGKIAESEKISTELCGRNVRYNFFKELKEKYNAKIATAHTSSDNTETVLFNLARGCGLKGISGIQPVRDYIIRPLIYTTRAQVEDHCKIYNLSFVTDSSNLTDDYTRNRIRHNVVPTLREINPELNSTINRFGNLMCEIDDYLQYQTDEATEMVATQNGYDAEKISKLHPALKKAVIRKICNLSGCDAEYRHITLICENLSGGAVNLPSGKRAVIKQNLFRITDVSQDNDYAEFIKKFEPDSTFDFNNKKYSICYGNSKNLLRADLAEKDLFFRTRKQGDRFTLPFRKVTKSLKKLFNELKIPEEKRDKLLILTDGETIYWIEGIGVSEQGRSKEVYGITIKWSN